MVWIFFLFLVQNTLGFFFALSSALILAPAVIFYGFSEGPGFGLLAGVTAGFFLDLLSTGRMGVQMAVFGILGAACGFLSSKVFRESFVTWGVVPLMAHLFIFFASRVIFGIFSENSSLGADQFFDTFSFLNILAMLSFSWATFWFLKKVSDRKPARRRAWKACRSCRGPQP